MIKKCIGLAICLVMLMALLTVTAFAEDHVPSSELAFDETGWHWSKCAVEGCEEHHHNPTEHVYDQEDGTKCICGKANPNVPQHGQSTTYAFNETNHWFKCTVDGCTDAAHQYGVEAHNFVQGVCACGAQHTCNTDAVGYNETEHWKECSICHTPASDTITPHTPNWADNGDGTHTGTCPDCAWTSTQNHKPSWVRTETSHVRKCDNCGAEVEGTSGDHVFENAQLGQVDCECGAKNPNHGKFKDTYESDAENHWRSCVVYGCEEKELAKHEYVGVTCKVCGAVDPNGATSYVMMDAAEEWIVDSSEGASFRSSAHIADFVQAEVDGVVLTSGYTVSEGSTVVTLSPTLLKSLPLGRHIVSIVSRNKNGELVRVSARFEILEEEGHFVTFKMNGHGKHIHPQFVENGKRVEKPHDPKEKGYIFCGWYTDRHFHHKFNFHTRIEEDTVLYAKWIVASPVPKTGDNSNMMLWASVLVAGLALTGAALLPRKKPSI